MRERKWKISNWWLNVGNLHLVYVQAIQTLLIARHFWKNFFLWGNPVHTRTQTKPLQIPCPRLKRVVLRCQKEQTEWVGLRLQAKKLGEPVPIIITSVAWKTCPITRAGPNLATNLANAKQHLVANDNQTQCHTNRWRFGHIPLEVPVGDGVADSLCNRLHQPNREETLFCSRCRGPRGPNTNQHDWFRNIAQLHSKKQTRHGLRERFLKNRENFAWQGGLLELVGHF